MRSGVLQVGGGITWSRPAICSEGHTLHTAGALPLSLSSGTMNNTWADRARDTGSIATDRAQRVVAAYGKRSGKISINVEISGNESVWDARSANLYLDVYLVGRVWGCMIGEPLLGWAGLDIGPTDSLYP